MECEDTTTPSCQQSWQSTPSPAKGNDAPPKAQHLSRAYIHHLIKANEILGATLLTQHNLWFYQDLMRDIRAAIENETFAAFKEKFIARYNGQKLD